MVSPLCDEVSPLCDVVSPLRYVVSPLGCSLFMARGRRCLEWGGGVKFAKPREMGGGGG